MSEGSERDMLESIDQRLDSIDTRLELISMQLAKLIDIVRTWSADLPPTRLRVNRTRPRTP